MGFRGSIAPASLKHLLAEIDDLAGAPFPGLYCPGLIEAMPPGAGGSSMPPFPGLYCPGLIEASRPAVVTPNKPLGFRGSIAPASLKPRQGWRWPVEFVGRFRGSIAPASLKLVGCRGARYGGPVVSGALLPRPH